MSTFAGLPWLEIDYARLIGRSNAA